MRSLLSHDMTEPYTRSEPISNEMKHYFIDENGRVVGRWRRDIQKKKIWQTREAASNSLNFVAFGSEVKLPANQHHSYTGRQDSEDSDGKKRFHDKAASVNTIMMGLVVDAL